MNKLSGLMVIAAALSLLVLPAGAQSVSGASKIALTTGFVNIYQSSYTAVGYNVILFNGTAGTTTLSVQNQAQLSAKGITVTLSDPSGTPTYAGKLTVMASAYTNLGTYNVILAASGSDPSAVNFTFTVYVISQTPTTILTTPSQNGATTTITSPTGGPGVTTVSTTTSTSTVTSMTTILSTTTTIPSGYSASSLGLVAIAAAAIVIIAVVVFMLMRRMASRSKKA